jgi:hypothetical protein
MGESGTSTASDAKLTPEAARPARMEASPGFQLLPVECLVNLTGHEVMLDSQVPPMSGDGWGSPTPTAISLPRMAASHGSTTGPGSVKDG